MFATRLHIIVLDRDGCIALLRKGGSLTLPSGHAEDSDVLAAARQAFAVKNLDSRQMIYEITAVRRFAAEQLRVTVIQAELHSVITIDGVLHHIFFAIQTVGDVSSDVVEFHSAGSLPENVSDITRQVLALWIKEETTPVKRFPRNSL